MKKLASLLLAIMLCFGITFALSENAVGNEWDWTPLDAMLNHNVVTGEQMAEIKTFIENELDIIASGNFPTPDEAQSNLLSDIMLEAVENGESSEAVLARLCLWELMVTDIITEDQLMHAICILAPKDPAMTPDTENRKFYTVK